MKATLHLHELGQSLWLYGISHDLLNSGTFKRYIEECSVAGMTSNLTVFAGPFGMTATVSAAADDAAAAL